MKSTYNKYVAITFYVMLSLCLISAIVLCCSSQQKMMTVYFDQGCLDQREVCLDTFIYDMGGDKGLDTIIKDLCECLDTLIIEDVNLRIKKGAITDHGLGGCMDGRRTGGGWLLTGTDTLCFSCNSFSLKKGDIFYETTVDAAALRRFNDIRKSYEEDYFNRINYPKRFDIYCNGILDSILVSKSFGWDYTGNIVEGKGGILVFDGNGGVKDVIRDYYSRGLFLRVVPLLFDPENDPEFTCTQKIMNLMGTMRSSITYASINQSGAEQIKWLIKNSTGKIPSDWMTGFDTDFDSYCSVFPSSVFSELGLDKNIWLREYLPISDSGYYGNRCGGRHNKECPADRQFENSKGFIFCYYADEHKMPSYYDTDGKKTIRIPVSENVTLYQTMHGVLLQKGDLYRWIYHEDQMERLSLNSIYKVTVSEQGEITVLVREKGREAVLKTLTFQLSDFE